MKTNSAPLSLTKTNGDPVAQEHYFARMFNKSNEINMKTQYELKEEPQHTYKYSELSFTAFSLNCISKAMPKKQGVKTAQSV